jgi:dihydroorotase (multifunctional complex type)
MGCMPNTDPPILTHQDLEAQIMRSQGRSWVDIWHYIALTSRNLEAFNDPNVRRIAHAGKLYMNHTTGGLKEDNPDILDQIGRTLAQSPTPFLVQVHAEANTTIQDGRDTADAAIKIFAETYGQKVHFCHVSNGEGVDRIEKAQRDGLQVTGEVAAHHLFLTKDDLPRLGPFGIMKPPLESKEDRTAVRRALNLGILAFLASDHAPHTKEEKEKGDPTPFGVPGLEHAIPLLITGCHEGWFDWRRLQAVLADEPARIFGLPHREQTYTVIDPNKRWTITDDNLETKCGWTPFKGMEVTGQIQDVVIRGNRVVRDGQVVGNPIGKVLFPTLS